MTSFLTLNSGRQQLQSLPVRSAGWIQGYGGASPASGWILEPDGIWVSLTHSSIRTIGGPLSFAAIAALWPQTLFSLIWQNYSATTCPLFTSGGVFANRGTSALNDWLASRRLQLPDYRGRVLVGAGQGTGLSNRNKGEIGGSETHALSVAELPSHGHTVPAVLRTPTVSGNAGGFELGDTSVGIGGSISTSSSGSGAAHNNLQPWVGDHIFISAGTRG